MCFFQLNGIKKKRAITAAQTKVKLLPVKFIENQTFNKLKSSADGIGKTNINVELFTTPISPHFSDETATNQSNAHFDYACINSRPLEFS